MSFRRWLSIAVVFGIGLFGLFGAAEAATATGRTMGVGLAVACVLAGFIVLKQHFDGAPDNRFLSVMPQQPANALRLLVILGILALAGLFGATSSDPYLYWAGLTLTAVSIILGFRAIRAYFDGRERSIDRHVE
ncbi:hypothetical protein [Fodinicurvata sp. EGI_FJ10296]|uniref:hypothetical protein n=1 Tax=Fodinicurvata sp. EGI_FJ10296 TaxID=3231908 RepID=UPI0034553A97